MIDPIGLVGVVRHVAGRGGPTVVFLDGAGSHGSLWADYALWCSEAGMGTVQVSWTGAPAAGEPAVVEMWSHALAAVLADQVSGAVRLAGFSFGAYVAQQLAGDRPELVERLFLVATRARAGLFDRELARVRDTWVERSSEVRAVETAMMMLSPETLADDDRAADWLDVLSWGTDDAAVLTAQNAASAVLDQRQVLPHVTADTTVVAFADDVIAAPVVGRQVAELITDARFVEVGRAGHLGLAEAGAAVMPIFRRAVGR